MDSGRWRERARREWEMARRSDPGILLWSSRLFPPLLRELPDAPILLYARGDAGLLSGPSIALVGSREASAHGLEVSFHFARALSQSGITVVSGMAAGIDGRAHEGALAGVGKSVGVLGAGIDIVYPQKNAALFSGMERSGLLVSEFMPHEPPAANNFPIRNRIISGLALAVVVIEAARKSGSLITARLALEQDREVYAVPGPALDSHCGGSQDLVRQGAKPVFGPEDILADLSGRLKPYGLQNAFRQFEQSPCGPEAKAAPAPCAEAEALLGGGLPERMLETLRKSGPFTLDALAEKLDVPVSELNVSLLGLEMAGSVRRLPGARLEAI